MNDIFSPFASASFQLSVNNFGAYAYCFKRGPIFIFCKSIESVEIKASILTSITPLYSFAGDIITQASTGASGELLRDTTEETSFVVRNVQGKFESETDISTSGISVSNKSITSSSNVVNLLLSQDSTYSKDATISLVEKANTDNIS